MGMGSAGRGRHVKALADAAPGGAFDPRGLESIRSADLGYRARWRVLRYTQYGLDWDITGLQLTPVNPEPGLPTLAIIHGGSANWYEFFVDPLNRAGLGQFLAQRLPIILITIPGNYTDGGWTEEQFDARIPGYLVPQMISREEARIRNAVFTFKLVAEGVRRLLEQTTTGPLLVLGHSTGGEIQFLLKESSLKARLDDRSIGWGTGGPARITKEIDDQFGERADRVIQYGRYPRVDGLRAHGPEGYVASTTLARSIRSRATRSSRSRRGGTKRKTAAGLNSSKCSRTWSARDWSNIVRGSRKRSGTRWTGILTGSTRTR